MRNLISKLRFERLRQAFSGPAVEGEVKPAPREVLEIQEALALSEALWCDLLAHCGGEAQPGLRQSSDGFSSINVFGRPVTAVETTGAGEAIACGVGSALTGMRTAVFLGGDDIAEGYAQLQMAGGRHVPLVVHATFREGFGAGGSHVGYHAASDLGLFLAMPTSVQQAIDLTILARWLAERSLVPGLVALDRRTVESAALPTADLVTSFLGESQAEFPAPTPSQLLLFGPERPAVPAWFNPDRPVAFGALQGSNDGASATIGRQAFFLNHFPQLLREGMERLSTLTGRRLSLVELEGVERAEIVIVAQGSAYETARAAARYLRLERKVPVGVMGLTWLRPFPTDAVRENLSDRKAVIVLECSGALLSEEGPLMRELRRAVPGASTSWISAGFGSHGQPLAVGQVMRLVSEVRERKARSRVWLGVVSGPGRIGDFPKREGLIRSVGSDYPHLAQDASALEEKLSAPSLRTVQWIGSASVDASEVLSRLADVCSQASGPAVKGFSWLPEPGVLSVRISSGPEELPIAESGTAVDVLLMGRHGLDLVYNPLAELKSGAQVVIETDRTPFEIWQLLPEFWRSEIQRLRLRIFRAGSFEDMLAAAAAFLTGAVDVPFEEVKPQTDIPDEGLDEVPALIRGIRESGPAYDSLARFWGEVMQPKRAGISDNFPDPLVTVDAVPSLSAALARPRATARPQMPVLVAEKCTGCGRCWPVCPDSAIGVTALTPAEFLDAAADAAGHEGKTAAAVRRAHRNVAARLTSDLMQSAARAVTEGMLLDAYRGAVAKMPVKPEDRPEYDRIFAGTAASANRLSPVVCDSFFRGPERSQKGSGRLLLLAINPDACQGCRLCITSCPEAALAPYDRAGSVWTDARAGWKLWEALPDPPPEYIEQSAAHLDLGPIAARLLSRRASQVQAVGSFGEPGSGERLACRMVAALVQSTVGSQIEAQAASAADLAAQLRDRLHAQLAAGLAQADPGAVEAALKGLPRRRVTLSEVSERLGALGKAVSVDPARTLRLAQCAHQLEQEVWSLREGPSGLGRAAFGVVVAGHRVARWAGRFPNHSYRAPLVVDPTPEGAGLVLGLARATSLKHLEAVKTLRRARLYLEDPPDLPGKLAALEDLTWEALTEEERRACPPLVVWMDDTALNQQGLGAVNRLMTANLPVKLVILDAKSELNAIEPILLGISAQNVFVLSSSPACPQHLTEGIFRSLGHAGPALIHLHVPLPQEHGFDPSLTLEQSLRAVESRMHPLLRFDPGGADGFGARFSIEGNPEIQNPGWAGFSPMEWAMGEARFRRYLSPATDDSSAVDWADYLAKPAAEREGLQPVVLDPESGKPYRIAEAFLEMVDRRLRLWTAYQEMAGVRSSFLDQVRSETEAEVTAKLRNEMEALRAECETRVAQARAEMDGRMTAILRDRLLALAGFAPESQAGKE